MSPFLSLNKSDALKGAIVAVIAAVLTWLASAVNQPGFQLSDFATIDWLQVGQIAITTLLAYLAKNLGSTKNGKFLGKIG